VKRVSAQIAPWAPFDQVAFDQEIDELHCARAIDAERATERGLIAAGIGPNQEQRRQFCGCEAMEGERTAGVLHDVHIRPL